MPNRPKMPAWASNMKVWVAVIIALPAIYAGAAGMGLDLPRPTWLAEHQADVVKITTAHAQDMTYVGKELKQTLKLVAANACAIVEADRKRIRGDYFAIKDRAELYKQKNQAVPQWIRDRERVVQERKRENERQRSIKKCP